MRRIDIGLEKNLISLPMFTHPFEQVCPTREGGGHCINSGQTELVDNSSPGAHDAMMKKEYKSAAQWTNLLYSIPSKQASLLQFPPSQPAMQTARCINSVRAPEFHTVSLSFHSVFLVVAGVFDPSSQRILLRPFPLPSFPLLSCTSLTAMWNAKEEQESMGKDS